MAGARMVLVTVVSGHVGGAMADRLAAGGLRVHLARRTFGQTVAELTARARSQPAQERR
jgi:nucleoside-diphosphate-sugar epimerase